MIKGAFAYDCTEHPYGGCDRRGARRGRAPLDVATADPVTGAAITYRIDGDGTITGASHPDAVLSFLRPGQPWGDNVITSFCRYVWQFTSPATAQQWTVAHPGTFVLSPGDAAELARRHAARIFGATSA